MPSKMHLSLESGKVKEYIFIEEDSVKIMHKDNGEIQIQEMDKGTEEQEDKEKVIQIVPIKSEIK